MGKKAKFKKLRKMAEEMPVILTDHIVTEKRSGQSLINEGITKAGDVTVKRGKDYIKKKTVQQPVNHARKMKKLYNQYGIKGVQIYKQAVDRYVSNQEAKKDTN